MIREKEFNGRPGIGMLLLFLALFMTSSSGSSGPGWQSRGGTCSARRR